MFNKVFCLLIVFVFLLTFCSCGNCKDNKHTFEEKTITESTCEREGIIKKTCTECGYEEEHSVSKLEHNYCEVDCTATCIEGGKRNLKCSGCGNTYEENVEALGHKWVEATCQKAKHCSLCDITEGEKSRHNFVNGSCSFCNKTIIISMPSFPKKVSELKYNGKIESTVEISDISYEITNYGDSDYSVEFTICGKKLYDAKGDNHSRETTLGYKLYDLDGMVIYSGTLLTTSVSVGETFSRSLPYEGMRVKGISAGEYRLEIFDSQ